MFTISAGAGFLPSTAQSFLRLWTIDIVTSFTDPHPKSGGLGSEQGKYPPK